MRNWLTLPAMVIVADELRAYLDPSGRVEEVEVPLQTQASGLEVRYCDIDFSASPEAVISHLNELAEPDRLAEGYPATARYPELGLAIWMDPTRESWLNGAYQSLILRRPWRRRRLTPT
jgi:hypothetical protein